MPKRGWLLAIRPDIYYGDSAKEALMFFRQIVLGQIDELIQEADLLEMSQEAVDFEMPNTIPEDWK